MGEKKRRLEAIKKTHGVDAQAAQNILETQAKVRAADHKVLIVGNGSSPLQKSVATMMAAIHAMSSAIAIGARNPYSSPKNGFRTASRKRRGGKK